MVVEATDIMEVVEIDTMEVVEIDTMVEVDVDIGKRKKAARTLRPQQNQQRPFVTKLLE